MPIAHFLHLIFLYISRELGARSAGDPPYVGGGDSPRFYQTEGTPAMFSKNGSLSSLDLDDGDTNLNKGNPARHKDGN